MSPRTSFVRRLRIGLGTVVITSLLGLSSIALSGREVDAALARSQRALSLLSDVKELEIRFGEARAAEREFLLDDAHSPAFNESARDDTPALLDHAAALRELHALLQRLGTDPEAKELALDAMGRGVDAYAATFHEIVKLMRERGGFGSGLTVVLRESTHSLEDALEHLDPARASDLRRDLSTLVADEGLYARFQAGPTRFYVTQLAAVLHDDVDAMKLPTERAQPLQDAITRYQSAWSRTLEIDDQVGATAGEGLRQELRRQQQAIASDAAHAEEVARQRFSDAQRAAGLALRVAWAASVGTALLAMALGGALALVLGRQLRRSLSALLSAVQAYTAGDREARVGRLPRQDEFALVGAAFDALAEKLTDATAELEEMNASLELAVKGDAKGLLERIRSLAASHKSID